MSLLLGRGLVFTAYLLLPTIVLLGTSQASRHWRRLAAVLNTSGLTYCSIALVVITNGTIEAHFHFFIMIGLIALYQDWVPLGVNIALTVISHGLGSALRANLIFNHPAAQQNPWLWAGIHGVAVLVAYAGVVAFWGITEDDQNDRVELTRRLTEARAAQQAAALEDINAVFLNIAHRSQAIVHRQLQVLDKAERAEEDPDQLGLLFQLDHLTTRERRNAENLIILGGGQPGRQWRNPVPLLELVRSAASETEQYTRVAIGRMPRMMVAGRAVGDLIHLLAELLDNATSFSPPDARIDVRGNRVGRGVVLEIEDQGLGYRAGAARAAERDAAQRLQHRAERQVAGLAAGAVRGQPAGPAARHQRHPGRVGLRRRAGDRAGADDPVDRGPGRRRRARRHGAGRHRSGAAAGAQRQHGNGTNGNGHRPQPRPRHARNGRAAEAAPVEAGPGHAGPGRAGLGPVGSDGPADAGPTGADPAGAGPSRRRPSRRRRGNGWPAGTPSGTPRPSRWSPSTSRSNRPRSSGPCVRSAATRASRRRPPPCRRTTRWHSPGPARPPGLPTRKRQSHVAPELRDAPDSEEHGRDPTRPRSRPSPSPTTPRRNGPVPGWRRSSAGPPAAGPTSTTPDPEEHHE